MLLQELLLQAHLDIHPVMAVASAFRMSGSNGQPPNKVRKLNFATNHDEPENPSGTQYTDLRREIDGLRRYIEELGEHLKASQESLAKETKAEIGLLAEKVGTQNAYLRQILQRGAQSTEAQGSTFPISSPEEMIALDLKISPENRQIYITKEMKELLPQANLSKSIKKVLEEEPSPVYQAWEHQSPVRGPSYRHTDSLPTDPTWRPDLRGVEGILGRRDIVIRFLLSGLHPLAPPGRSELASKIWRRKARGERRNGSRESLLVLLDQSWVRSQVIRADFRAGTSAYPLTLSPLCPVVPDDLQIFCKQTLAGLRRRPRLEKLPVGPEKLAALVRRTAEDFGYCFQIARAREGEARSRRWYSRSMNRELCYREMRYHGAPALPISMEPSSRTGVEPPPNSPRRSTDSQSTDPNTVNPGVMPTWSQADADARDAALELEAARGAADWGQVDWVAAPASWRLQGLYGLVPVSLLTAVFRVRGHACGRDIRVRIRTSGRLFPFGYADPPFGLTSGH
ncbi:hypothetical protein ACLKA6_006054 [Drosophila palustris]